MLSLQIVIATLENFETSSRVDTVNHPETQRHWVGEVLLAERRAAVALVRDAILKLTMHRTVEQPGLSLGDEPCFKCH